ncbi:50S ribosomal protein L3 [Candidatus Dojkabacteria bacterium]|uniref:Large ribosomal subunit protein uL3 n=1 Tax=Candidatus Dojkabacteria bacterium TaxID=2099670 RepID=A0A955ICU9_9BACT|nr:50S ribosomal protein L3 [Candidatus Dojkabacteria bacterium]
MKAIIGKKIGMTHLFAEDGGQVPVTVLEVADVKVAKHLKDGEAVSHIEISKGQAGKANKADTGNYKELGYVPSFKFIFKPSTEQSTELTVGSVIAADIFAVGDLVDVIADSKGKGFQGGVKRWGFHGGPKTHGQSDRHRAPGSIGSGTTLGRVFKNTKMAGHMGAKRKTVQNLKVVAVDVQENLLAVSGAVPGANGSYVVIKSAVKARA